MSELFSWPTVTVGMSPPCVNDDPPTPGCGAAAGRFRLLIATGITVALRVARRTRTTPGRVPWSAAGRPRTGHRSRPRRCGGARSQDSGFLASAASVHPSTGRTPPAGHRYPRAPGPTRRPGARARGRTGASDLAARDRGSQDRKPSRPLPARAMSAIDTLLEMGDGNEYRQAGNGEHGIRAQAARGKAGWIRRVRGIGRVFYLPSDRVAGGKRWN